MNKKVRAIFLDRDGVINYDVGHLHEKGGVRLLSHVEELRKLQGRGFILVIVSNQSVVARGLLDENGLREIDKSIRQKLEKVGVKIDASYYCPHHPDFTGPCQCRKPEPGLYLRAIKELNIDPEGSVAIGNKLSDLEAARRAGVNFGILVKRNGKSWEANKGELAKIEYKTANISEAVKIVLEKEK